MDERELTTPTYDIGNGYTPNDAVPSEPGFTSEPVYQPDPAYQQGPAAPVNPPEAPELNLEKAVDGIAETKKRNYERYLEEGEWTPEQQAPGYTGQAGPLPGQGGVFQQSPYQNSGYQPAVTNDYNMYDNAAPAYNNVAGLEEPVTLGEWIVSLLLMLVPCANIVLMFVWAFSKTEKKSKSNFFKAQLIITGIGVALYLVALIFIVIMGVIGARAMY